MARSEPGHIRIDNRVEPLTEESRQIAEAAEAAASRAIAAHKAAGRTIYYRDPEFPGYTVQEHPDGRRFLARRGPAPRYERQVIREIPGR